MPDRGAFQKHHYSAERLSSLNRSDSRSRSYYCAMQRFPIFLAKSLVIQGQLKTWLRAIEALERVGVSSFCWLTDQVRFEESIGRSNAVTRGSYATSLAGSFVQPFLTSGLPKSPPSCSEANEVWALLVAPDLFWATICCPNCLTWIIPSSPGLKCRFCLLEFYLTISRKGIEC